MLGKNARAFVAGLLMALGPSSVRQSAAWDYSYTERPKQQVEERAPYAGFYEPFQLYPKSLRVYYSKNKDGYAAGGLATAQTGRHSLSAEGVANVQNTDVQDRLKAGALGYGYDGRNIDANLSLSAGGDNFRKTTVAPTDVMEQEAVQSRFGVRGRLDAEDFGGMLQYGLGKTDDKSRVRVTDPNVFVPVSIYSPVLVKDSGILARLVARSDYGEFGAAYRRLMNSIAASLETNVGGTITRKSLLDRKDASEQQILSYRNSDWSFLGSDMDAYAEFSRSNGAGVSRWPGGNAFLAASPRRWERQLALHGGSNNAVDGLGLVWGLKPGDYLRALLDLDKDVTFTNFQRGMAEREYRKAFFRNSGFSAGAGWQEQSREGYGYQGFVSAPVEALGLNLALRGETGAVRDEAEFVVQAVLGKDISVDVSPRYARDKAGKHIDRVLSTGLTWSFGNER